MKTFTAVGLLVLSCARAQAGGSGSTVWGARSAPASPAAWVGPITAFFSQAAPGEMRWLLGDSPTRFMAQTNPDLSFGIQSMDPAQLDRLAVELHRLGTDPEAFAGEALDFDKRMLLMDAASQAGMAADREARALLASVPEGGVNYAAVNRLDETVERFWAKDAIYVQLELRRKLQGLREEIARVQQARAEAVDAFLRELPGKIRTEAFTFGDILRQEQGGWVLVDHSPVPFNTLEEAVDSRLWDIQNAAAGPWSLGPLYQLSGVLRKYSTQQALDGEGGIAKQTELLARVKAAEEDMEARVAAPPEPKLAWTLAQFKAHEETGRLPGAVAIKYMLGQYDKFFYGMPSLTMGNRIAAWLATGRPKEGYPAWETLAEVKTLAIQRLHRRALQWMLGFFAALAGLAVAGVLGPIPLWLGVPMFAVVFVPMGVFFWFLVRRDMLRTGYTGEDAGRKVLNFLSASKPAD